MVGAHRLSWPGGPRAPRHRDRTVTDVLVVGGGPAGLTAALAAAERGFDTHLVEAAPTLGGMAASITVAGTRVDLGSHRLHPAAPPRVRVLLDRLLGDDLQTRQRRGRLRLGDRWVGFPFGPVELVRSVPPAFAAAAARDLVGRPLRRARDGSYAEVVRVGLGPAALEGFHGPMATKLWGIDPSGLAGELARRRIPVRSPGSLVRKVITAARPGGRTFLYPRRGYGQIVERLAEAAVEAGATVETGRAVRRVSLDPGGSDGPVVTLDGGRPRSVGRLVWTAAPSALAGLVDTAPGAGPAEPGSSRATGLLPTGSDVDRAVPHRGLVLAYLVVDGAPWTPYDAHYVPDPDVIFSRLSEPRNYRDGDDPTDRTVLCAEVPCTAGDDLWTADEATMADLVLEGIDRLDLPTPRVAGFELRRLPAVYPLVEVGREGDRRHLLDWSDALPGVTVVGRHGRVVADNLHHVVDMALTAVDCLGPDGSWDGRAWLRAAGRFESFVIED